MQYNYLLKKCQESSWTKYGVLKNGIFWRQGVQRQVNMAFEIAKCLIGVSIVGPFDQT